MRSKLLFLLTIFVFSGAYAQVTVQSTPTLVDVENLITDVLVGGSTNCFQVNNVSKFSGVDAGGGNPNGIGSFNANGTNFPFEEGIVLSSGDINTLPGPNTTLQSNGNTTWGGDPDLDAAAGVAQTINASFIQFDFVPTVTELSFDFIMASEEYDQNFECTFSDAFAFILTDLTSGVVQNLAVLPGTTIPIRVTNIHPDVPGQCPAINEAFFGQYNFAPFNDANTAPTNYNGRTTVLTAMASVVSGNPYSIKLVVGDDSNGGFDTAFDIAVFIEAGSFNIGVDLGDDLTIAGDTNACAGDVVTLDASNGVALGSLFQWQVFNNGTGVFEDIVGETNPTLDVTVTGEYQVVVTSTTGGCDGADSIIVEFASAVATAPIDQITCDDVSNDGFEIFDLDALIDPIIIGTQNPAEVEVTFHTLLNDAQMDINPILTPAAYNSDNATIFIRVESAFDDTCFDTASFMLIVNERPIPVDPGPFIVCDNATDGSDTNGFTEFDLSTLTNTILGTQDPTQFTLTYHIDANDALLDQNPLPLLFTNTIMGGQTIAVRLENDNFTDCFTVIPLDLVVAPLPVIINPAPLLTQCDDDTDGFTVFNLLEAGALISADAANETFQFFDSLGFAIPDPIAYTNSVVNNETIDVIVTTVNGCSRPAQLILEVDTSQIPADFLLEYTACDTDSDGISTFDFSDATPQVLALFPAGQLLTVTYYETLQEAQSEVNAIPDISNYTNVLP
ncbi:choice-of-anchor L domain-containing protein, partial [uncultured Dokdonia sp.]